MKEELQGSNDEHSKLKVQRINQELQKVKALLDHQKKKEDMNKLIKKLQAYMPTSPEKAGPGSRDQAVKYQSEFVIHQDKLDEYKRRRKARYAQSMGVTIEGTESGPKARPKTAIGGSISLVDKENWNTQANRSFGKTPNMSPTKQGLINLDLIQKEVRKTMRMEEI